jgi:predicted DNA-binding transcriptional regulator YafY
MEVLLVIGLVCFVIYKWLASGEASINGTPNNTKPSHPSMVKRNEAPLIIDSDFQTIIKNAIKNETSIKITYTDLEGQVTTRTITPKQLFLTDVSGELALTAFCHLRREKRTFIVSKISNINAR